MACGTVITVTHSEGDEELTFHSPDQAKSVAEKLLDQLPEGAVVRINVRHADGGSWTQRVHLENGKVCASFDFSQATTENLMEAAGFGD